MKYPGAQSSGKDASVEIGRVSNTNEMTSLTAVSPPTAQERAQQRQLIQKVEAVNSSHLFGENTELTFHIDRQSRRAILQIVDRETREVLRQLPPESVLELLTDGK